MNIDIQYTLTREDWDEALGKNSAWVAQNWASRILLIIVVSIAVMLVVARERDEQILSSSLFSITLGLLLAIFLWLVVSLGRRNFPRALWEGNCLNRGACTVSISESNLSITQENRQSTWQWPAFVRFDATKNLLLLYVSRQVFFPIPKRAFSAAELDTFVRLLIRILPPGARFEEAYAAMQRSAPPPARRAPQIQPLESRDFM